MSVKSLQITSSHPGRTVAISAYNRDNTSAIHHATKSPHPQLTRGKPGVRPPIPTLAQALKATLLYYRHNLIEELLADLFGTFQ